MSIELSTLYIRNENREKQRPRENNERREGRGVEEEMEGKASEGKQRDQDLLTEVFWTRIMNT